MATLDIALADLRAVQASLAGEGAPAQTSRGALGRSLASLEPRQRETLAASLLTSSPGSRRPRTPPRRRPPAGPRPTMHCARCRW